MTHTQPGKNDSAWTSLFRVGGVAALLAGLIFRRNIGAEVSLFTGVEAIPQSAAGWFALLQDSPFIALAFLAIFDVVNYALVGLVFLALGAALWHSHKPLAAMALAGGLMGVAIRLTTNTALTMLSLSQQYASATSEAQRATLLAAGQAVLAFQDPLAVYPATGAYVSVVLVAVAGLLFSVIMLRSRLFGRATALIGILAGACDLLYCLTLPFAPVLRVVFVAAAGLFWMIWHLLIGRRLLQLPKG